MSKVSSRRRKPSRTRPSHAEAEFGYPRPQLRRDHWTSLNGLWDFHLDPDGALSEPSSVEFDSQIVVPFAPRDARQRCTQHRLLPGGVVSPLNRRSGPVKR